MTAGHQQAAGRLDRALAGLQAGTIGVLNMLLWMGICSVWRGEDFWTGPNLFAGAVYPQAAFRSGFEWNTAFGVALYILLYGTLGTLFALAAGRPMTSRRLALLAMAFGLGWYWIVFQWLWRATRLAALLHGGGDTLFLVGHLIYGMLLGGFPRYLPKPVVPETIPPAAEEKGGVQSETATD